MKKIGMIFNSSSKKQRGSVELIVIAATSAVTLITLLSSVFTVNHKQTTSTEAQVLAATTVNLNPVADSMVRKEEATRNYGSVTELVSQGNDFRAVYFKFDLKALAGKTIISAKLHLKTISEGGSDDDFSIKYIANNNWTESGITYNNSYNSSDSTLKPSTQLATISDPNSNSTIESILTSIVSQKKGDFLSVILVPNTTSTDAMRIYSREASAKPVLVIEYDTPTPTPTQIPPTVTPTRTPTIPCPWPTVPYCPNGSIVPGSPSSNQCPTLICITHTPTPTPNTGFGGITMGQTVSGTIFITMYVNQTKSVRFFIDGSLVNEDTVYPYSFGGETNGTSNGFDTKKLTNGSHTLKAEVLTTSGVTQIYSVTFVVNNPVTPTPTCIPLPSCAWPGANPICDLAAPPTGGSYCAAPTTTPTPSVYPLSVTTDTVSLKADNFYILAGGKKYYPKVNTPISANSDPGSKTYTTLELKWPDGTNGETEMRLNMYFSADSSNWWATELRTYDGNKPGNWIIYKNNYFPTPLGNSFINPGEQIITLSGTDPTVSMIYFKNLKLQAFTKNTPTVVPSGTTCSKKPMGDANCDNQVDMIDFEIWREGFIVYSTKTAAEFATWRSEHKAKGEDPDFVIDTAVDLADFEAWRSGFVATINPLPTIINDNCMPVNNTIIVDANNPQNCQEIQIAVDNSPNINGTILIKPGDYILTGVKKHLVLGTFGLLVTGKKNLTIKAADTYQKPRLYVKNVNHGIIWHNASGTLSHLDIYGNYNDESQNSLVRVILTEPQLKLYFDGNHLHDAGRSALALVANGGGNNTSKIDMIYNLIQNANGIQVSNLYTSITKNDIKNGSGHGISFHPEGSQILSTISDNLITGHAGSGISLIGKSGSNTEISYNTIVSNGGTQTQNPINSAGIVIQGGGTYKLHSNIIANNSNIYGVWKKTDSVHTDAVITLSYNDLIGNYNNYYNIPDPFGQNGNISQNPLFSTDYCLKSGSPALYGNASTKKEYMGHYGPCI